MSIGTPAATSTGELLVEVRLVDRRRLLSLAFEMHAIRVAKRRRD